MGVSVEVTERRLHIVRFHSGLGPGKRLCGKPVDRGHRRVAMERPTAAGALEVVLAAKQELS
jgi:hypothetical protein